jgi:hypothetical protein
MALDSLGDDQEFDIPGVVSLGWDAASRSVFVVWKGGGTSADFYALLEAEIRALGARSAQHMLADLRRQPPLDVDAQDFGDHNWLPRALAIGLKRLAIVVPENRDAAVNVEDRLGSTARDQLEVGFFHSVDAAREWLNG